MKSLLVFAVCFVALTLFADIERTAAAAIQSYLSESGISQNQIRKAISGGLWSEERSALAITIPNNERSLCLVYLKTKDGDLKVVDVSKVESGNFGKLGFSRTHYDRFETIPTRWYDRTDHLQIEFRTHAWRNGQRYTTSEPLLISLVGEPLWR